MATPTATLLAEVEAAISACLTSQQYTVRGRMQQRARLSDLRQFRKELISESNEASNNSGSMSTVGIVRGPA